MAANHRDNTYANPTQHTIVTIALFCCILWYCIFFFAFILAVQSRLNVSKIFREQKCIIHMYYSAERDSIFWQKHFFLLAWSLLFTDKTNNYFWQKKVPRRKEIGNQKITEIFFSRQVELEMHGDDHIAFTWAEIWQSNDEIIKNRKWRGNEICNIQLTAVKNDNAKRAFTIFILITLFHSWL